MFIVQVISGWFVAHVGEIGLGWIHRVGQTCWSDHMRSVLQKTFSHVLDHSQSVLYDVVTGARPVGWIAWCRIYLLVCSV